MAIGCMHGCPLDYHEPSCPMAIRQAEQDRAQQDDPRLRATTQALYDLGYRDGYAAAVRDLEALRDQGVGRAERVVGEVDPS